MASEGLAWRVVPYLSRKPRAMEPVIHLLIFYDASWTHPLCLHEISN